MPDTRSCEQCGAVFVPRREHARFCCVRCRASWNREHTGDPESAACALRWCITAMTDTIEQLPLVGAWDTTRACAAVGEAVWQVTLVDATLVRHHLDAYDGVLAAFTPSGRQLIEQTLAGLRYVRNHIGTEASLAQFIQPGTGARQGCITNWTWTAVPDPAPGVLAPRGKAWETARFRAYEAHLAGHPLRETFIRAAAFLNLAAAHARAAPSEIPALQGCRPVTAGKQMSALAQIRPQQVVKEAVTWDSARERTSGPLRSREEA